MICLGLGLFGVLWAMTRLANTALDATVAGYLIGGRGAPRRVRAHRAPGGSSRCCRCPSSGCRPCRPPCSPRCSRAWPASPCCSCSSCTCRARAVSPPSTPRCCWSPATCSGRWSGRTRARLADRRGPVLPATAGLAIQVVALAIYAQLTNDHPAVGGGAGEHRQRHRGELLLPGQQLGGDEGGAAGGVRHRVGDAADVREHRDGVLASR